MNEPVIFKRNEFDRLFEVLHTLGYKVVGPTLQDEAIVYGELASAKDLPEGYTDEQEGGHYWLKK